MGVAGYFDDVVTVPEEVDPDEAEDFDFDPPEVPLGSGRGASEEMERYFAEMEARMRQAYELAKRCREKGYDPEPRVEIPPAIDLAARVEELVGPKGVADRIRELAKDKNREEMSLIVAKEAAAGKFGPPSELSQKAASDPKTQALDQAIRTGLAILTEGILVAPLEGIAGVRILQNDNGTDCVAISFAGPIRAAGGTGQALSVLIADVVRRELGIGKYVPTEREIARMKEEIPAYRQAANLQYTPSNDEIELIMKNCPVMIDGEGTEKEEVGGNRDLPRLETNQLRGGACLVLAEGMTQKAPKIQKNVKALKLDGWDFIDQIIELVKKKGSSGGGEGGGKKFTDPWAKESELVVAPDAKYPGGRPPIEPNPKFLADLIAGRPVFAYPSRKGGWRLRYGRSRTGGLATTSIHPAAMALTDDFLAAGTQMKIERPGKATACTPCDTIDVPIALLANGNLVEVPTYKIGKQLRPLIREVVDLGEMLIPYGEFAENNKPLPQSPWCDEWWRHVAREATGGDVPELHTSQEAFAFAERTQTPLHPKWNLFWHDISLDDVRRLRALVEAHGRWVAVPAHEPQPTLPTPEAFTLELPRAVAEEPFDPSVEEKLQRSCKSLLMELGALHECTTVKDTIRFGRHAYAFVRCLGLDVEHDKLVARRSVNGPETMGVAGTCAYVGALAGVKIRPRAMFRIGTRMGRPEKAAERKMNPPVHLLFPIGIAGGPQRLMSDAVKVNKIEIEIGDRSCPQCRKHMVTYSCEACGVHTEHVPPKGGNRLEPRLLEIAPLWDAALKRLRMENAPDQVKAVQGLISRAKAPEPIEKGLLRAKHNLFTFKDATVRFDMININLTHFKPREAHVSIEKLREMGYTQDAHGKPLVSEDQVIELRVQDIIVSTSCMDYMLRTSQYVDDLLVRFYGYKPFYNCKSREDLLGHLFVALAPHTSGGVLCRIIGHTKAQGHYGHPYFHAAKRRNADGDEDCVMLLLDGLLNFSRAYLPSNRGGLMDAPLTLTMRLDPSEVDKEAHNVDCMFDYPLEFYEATMKHPVPKDVEKLIDMVAKRLGTPAQYEGFGFTHDTTDIAEGPELSAYKTIGSMMDKMTAQLELAARLRGVDAPDVAARVIGSHFLPDMMGNLKAFSKQSMRCTKCNTKYRRVPLTGKCRKCSNPNLTMTVHEGSVKKYLEVSKEICVRFEVSNYVQQRIEHISDSIDSVFQNDRVKKAKLSDFF